MRKFVLQQKGSCILKTDVNNDDDDEMCVLLLPQS